MEKLKWNKMEKKCRKWSYIKITPLNFKKFLENDILKNDNITEADLRKVYNYSLYPRDSKIYSVKEFDNINKGSMGGTNWCCFIKKGYKSFYFDSFGGNPDNFLNNHFSKPIN